jgi:hypothetical protein
VPFIVTTKRRLSCSCWGTVGEDESGMCQACHKGGEDVTTRAVATLEDVARVHPVLCIAESIERPGEDLMCLFDEAGGTVGPLPDGTTIQVEPIEIRRLAEAALVANDHHFGELTEAEVIAAYNESQQANA